MATVSWRWVTLALHLSLVLVCLPRFDRADHGIDRWTGSGGDHEHYVRQVRFYRGEEEQGAHAPFAYRPLVPALAAWFPVAPLTAIDLVNLAALLVALGALLALLRDLHLAPRWRAAGGALFVLSFPTFYYGTIGVVDPVLIAVLALGTLAIWRDRWGAVLLLVGVGTGVKETALLLWPVALARWWTADRGRGPAFVALAGIPLIWGIVYTFLRIYSGSTAMYFWWPSADVLMDNLLRPRCWIGSALTFGIPGVLASDYVIRRLLSGTRSRAELMRLGPALAGLTGSLVVFAWSLATAYADGRLIWPSVVYSIPLALGLVDHRRSGHTDDPVDGGME